MNLESINTGLELGNNFLNREVAYFIGMLLANEKTIINGVEYWQAPVRHNPKYANKLELEEHLKFIKEIADPLGKKNDTELNEYYSYKKIPLEKFTNGKKGIITLFKQVNNPYSIDDFIDDITKPLINSSREIQRAFLIGVFDGRGSYDKNGKFISLDCDNSKMEILVEQILGYFNLEMNVNSSPAGRARKGTNLKPRKTQLRIKSEDFLKNIGFISPVKYKKATEDMLSTYSTVNDPTLPGVKLIK